MNWHKPDCEWKRSVNLMENKDNGEQVIIGVHCWTCRASYYYPKLSELGDTQEYELVDGREIIKPAKIKEME